MFKFRTKLAVQRLAVQFQFYAVPAKALTNRIQHIYRSIQHCSTLLKLILLNNARNAMSVITFPPCSGFVSARDSLILKYVRIHD